MNLYICAVVFGFYSSENEKKCLSHVSSSVYLVESSTSDSALEHVKKKYEYNKEYFEPISYSITQLTAEDLAPFYSSMAKRYSDIPPGAKYRLVSDDVFTKGKEPWDGDRSWMVVPQENPNEQ